MAGAFPKPSCEESLDRGVGIGMLQDFGRETTVQATTMPGHDNHTLACRLPPLHEASRYPLHRMCQSPPNVSANSCAYAIVSSFWPLARASSSTRACSPYGEFRPTFLERGRRWKLRMCPRVQRFCSNIVGGRQLPRIQSARRLAGPENRGRHGPWRPRAPLADPAVRGWAYERQRGLMPSCWRR